MPEITQRRMTSQRRLILDELSQSTAHPTADELHTLVKKKLPKISLGTVYRNLDVLLEAGRIVKLDTCGKQKRFDGNTIPHAHIHCVQCGRVADVEAAIPAVDVSGVHVAGFHVQQACMELYGICDQCDNK